MLGPHAQAIMPSSRRSPRDRGSVAVVGPVGDSVVPRSFPMAGAADRHLLFGLLALQNGIVNQGQLVAAFQAWTLDKSREPGRPPGSSRRPDRRQAGAAGRARRGSSGSPRRRCARRAWPRLRLVSRPARAWRSWRPGHRGDAGPCGVRPWLDRGRRQRPHRRATPSARPPPTASDSACCGPMPAAGSARCSWRSMRELNREVALKQILERHADDPMSRQRFVIEAEVTGGLEHPGIVPVYGLGTYGDGRPYYAMRFIRGDSLKEAIDQFHADESLKKSPGQRTLELRKLLRRFLDVCNAIDYAHSRGAASRHQAGQYHRGQARRDPGGRLGAGQGRWAGPIRRLGRANADSEILDQRHVRDSAWLGAGYAGVYEPRAGTRRPRPRSAPAPTSTAWARRSTFCSPARRRWKGTILVPCSAPRRRESSRRPGSTTRRSTRRWRRSA